MLAKLNCYVGRNEKLSVFFHLIFLYLDGFLSNFFLVWDGQSLKALIDLLIDNSH